MNWLRKGLVSMLALLLFMSLVGGVAALSFKRNFSTPDNLKVWLAKSKVYESFVEATLAQTQADNVKDGGAGSVSLSDPVVQQAAKQHFTPQLLQSSVNSFLDSNYAWLKGQTGVPTFNIDLTQTKTDFANTVGQAVASRLAGLPVCTAAQLAQIQLPVDPLSVPCRPPTLDPSTEGKRVSAEIFSSSFFAKPNFTADTVGRNQESDKPYYVAASKAPEYFQWTLKMPWILTALALISAGFLILAAPDRRQGWRRVGIVLGGAGFMLVATKWLAERAVRGFTEEVSKGALDAVKQPQESLIHQIETSLFQFNMTVGVICLVLAGTIFVYLYQTRSGSSKPASVATPEPPKIPVNPAPPMPKPAVSDPSQVPQLKTTKRRRPPRLIQ